MNNIKNIKNKFNNNNNNNIIMNYYTTHDASCGFYPLDRKPKTISPALLKINKHDL